MKLHAALASFRGPFLILTPVCVFLGSSVAIANQTTIDWFSLILIFVGALLAHISVNTLNEYYDFKSGLDLHTQKTPFSGGSGSLPNNPEAAPTVLLIGVISFTATLLIGLYFIWQYGSGIIPIGLIGLITILTYTSWINKHPWLCLIAPGIGFGLLMVVGSAFILQGKYTLLSWLVGLVPFFLVNNLLLLNQYPDREADKAVGRNHLPIAFGTTFSTKIYALFAMATSMVIIGAVISNILPTLSLIALIPMPLALYALSGAKKYGDKLGGYPQYLASNVAVSLLTPLLLGVSIIS